MLSYLAYLTPEARPFLARTNLVEVHKMMLHTKYQGSLPCGFRQEEFFMFSLYKPMLNM